MMNRYRYYQRGFTPLEMSKTLKQKTKSLTGFTLIETLVTTFIMLLAITGIIAIYIMVSTVWQEGSVQIALQREASTSMEKMVRGMGGSDGIREAASAEDSSNNTKIEFTDIGGVERSFYLSSGKIYYDPDTSASSNEFVIAENVRTSTATDLPGFYVDLNEDTYIVTINLGLEKEVRRFNKMVKINVDYRTQVKLRN